MLVGFPSRLLVLIIVLFTVLLPLTFAQKDQELYVVERKPPSVVVVDRNTWEQTATIPLEGVPERVQFDASRGMLYILTREVFPLPPGRKRVWIDFENKSRSRVILVDTDSRKVVANIDFGVGYSDTTVCKGTADGEHLVCWDHVHDYELGRRCEAAKQQNCPDEFTRLSVVDRKGDYRTATTELNFSPSDVATNADASRIFVKGYQVVQQYGREPGSASLGLLGQVSFKRISEMLLSADNQWLYVFSEGAYSEKTKTIESARMYVLDPKTMTITAELPVGTMEFYYRYNLQVDAESGRVLLLTEPNEKQGELVLFNGTAAPVTLATGARPRFRRLGEEKGIWITTKQELRFLPAGGNEFTARVPLVSPPPQKMDLGGYPGPMIYLPQQRKAAMIVTDENYEPKAKIALFDLGQQRVQNVVTTGRGGAKVAKFFQELGGAMVMGAISSLTAPLGGGDPGYYTPSRQAQLVAKADGSIVYALNTSTSDVTAINTETGTVLGMYKVCACGILSPTLNGRFILAHSTDVYPYDEDQLTWLDTTTNKARPTLNLKERVRLIGGLEQTNQTLVLTTRSLMVWNSDTGELLRRTGNYNDVLTMAGPALIPVTTVPRPHYFDSPTLILDIAPAK